MKGYIAVGIALSVLAPVASALSVAKSVGVSFGPKNCVMLARSTAGSCVLSTECEGVDISNTEFAFDCVGGNGEVVRHSFGVGGFETSEEFDTEVKCSRCASVSAAVTAEKKVVKKVEAILKAVPKASAPIAHAVPEKPKQEEQIPGAVAMKAQATAGAKAKFWPFTSSDKKKKKETKKSTAVKYGPNGCVSVYKGHDDHCIMSTQCKKSDISKYEFGLVCVDKTGSPVKHIFGKDSFDSEETFDTLIKCHKCLGLEDIPDNVALAGEVATMAKDIGDLKAVMKNISINVGMLNDKVFPAAPAPGPAPAQAAGPAPAAAALVHAAVTHHRVSHGHLRHSHKKHHRHHRRRDDDDDDDDEDDEDDRRDERPVRYDDEEEQPKKAQYAPMNDVETASTQWTRSSDEAAVSDKDDDEDEDGGYDF